MNLLDALYDASFGGPIMTANLLTGQPLYTNLAGFPANYAPYGITLTGPLPSSMDDATTGGNLIKKTGETQITQPTDTSTKAKITFPLGISADFTTSTDLGKVFADAFGEYAGVAKTLGIVAIGGFLLYKLVEKAM